MYGNILYIQKNCVLAFRLGYIMYLLRTIKRLLRYKEVILVKSLLLCETSDKFSPKCKSFGSNDEAILTNL